jgi:hypothetical protein
MSDPMYHIGYGDVPAPEALVRFMREGWADFAEPAARGGVLVLRQDDSRNLSLPSRAGDIESRISGLLLE